MKIKNRLAVFFFLFIFISAGTLSAATDKLAVKYYNYGIKYHQKKNYRNALRYYNAAAKKDRKFWQAWLGLGICYYNLRKYRNAKLIFKYVLTLKPGQQTAQKYFDMMSPKKKVIAEKKDEGPRTKGDMAWRSALLPGLGQFYNDESVKGYLYSLGFLASVGAIIKYTIDQQNAVYDYENANTGFDEKYRIAEEATTRVFIPIGVAGTIWAMSIIDAFLSGADAQDARNIRKAYMPDSYTVAVNLIEYKF